MARDWTAAPLPLAGVAARLTDLAVLRRDIEPLLGPLGSLLEELDALLALIESSETTLHELNEAVTAVSILAPALMAMPVVGATAFLVNESLAELKIGLTEVEQVLRRAHLEAIRPAHGIIAEMRARLTRAGATLLDLEAPAEDWRTAVQDLVTRFAACQAAARPLDPAARAEAGVAFREILAAHRAELRRGQSAFQPIDRALTEISAATSWVAHALPALQRRSTLTTLTAVSTDLDQVLDSLTPVRTALQRIHEAVQPYTYLLDSMDLLIDTIVRPVLEPLLQPLIHFVSKRLGLDLDQVEALRQDALELGSWEPTIEHHAKALQIGQAALARGRAHFTARLAALRALPMEQECHDLAARLQELTVSRADGSPAPSGWGRGESAAPPD